MRRGLRLGGRVFLLVAGISLLVVTLLLLLGQQHREAYLVVGEGANSVKPSPLPLIITGLTAAAGIATLVSLGLYLLALRSLNRLAEGAAMIGSGDLTHRIVLDREDELGLVAQVLNDMAERVSLLVSGLEQRVKERTAAWERRAAQLEAANLVGQVVARQRNVNALLDAAVNAISDSFGFYHVGIYILDDNREWAILRAASSEGGKRMLNRGHRLQVGGRSRHCFVGVVETVATSGRPRIAFNEGQDAVWFQNPDLPRTQAEIALPLMAECGVVGVLDIHTDRPVADDGGTHHRSSFTDDDIGTLQLVADQLATALTSVRGIETIEAKLEELQALQVDYSRRGWARVARRMRPMAYEYDRVETTPVPPLPVPDDLAEGRTPHKIVMDGGMPVVLDALRVGGRTLGFLGLSDPQRVWSDEELALVDSVGEQVALALENARLFEDTQSNERQQYLISSVLQVASNPDFSAEHVLREIASILAQGLDMVVVIFTFPYPGRPVVRSHAVVDPDGQQLTLFEEDLVLSREHYIFFQGLETADLGPMGPLLGSHWEPGTGLVAPDGASSSSQLGQVSWLRTEALADRYDLERVLYVPMRSAGARADSGGRSGFIGFIQRAASPPLDPDTRDLAQSLASQVAVVLENLNLTQETRQRSEELRKLYRISLDLSEQLAPDDVLNRIVEQGALLLAADAANLWIYQARPNCGSQTSSTEVLQLAYEYQGGAEGHLGYTSRGDGGLAGAALAGRQTIFVDDYASWEGHIPELVSPRFHGMMAVPLVGRFGPLGVFVALSEQAGAFGEREAGLADLFSAQAATALENARLNEDAQRRAEEFSQLYEAGIDLITILDAEELLKRAADWAREIFDAERAVVLLQDPRSETFVQGISASDPAYMLLEEDGTDHRGGEHHRGGGSVETEAVNITAAVDAPDPVGVGTIRTRESLLVADNRDSSFPGAVRLVDVGLLSQMGTPLRIGDEVLGALFVDGAEPGQFSEGDVALLEFLAAQVSSALQNSIQFGQTGEALAVVGRQARYQTNISQAVALLNDRGTAATVDVLRLLSDAAEAPMIIYYEAAGNQDQPAWRLKESWVVEERSPSDSDPHRHLDDGLLQLLDPARLATWRQMLVENGQAMGTCDNLAQDSVSQDDLPLDEWAALFPFESGAVLGLGVPGQAEIPGFLALFRDTVELWHEQEIVALQTVAAALSNTLARETLFQQVQDTLRETEALYRGGAALSEASTYEGILEVLLAHSVLGREVRTATVLLFDRPWNGEQRPAYAEVVAQGGMHRRGEEPEAELRRRYRLDGFPMTLQVMQDGSPVFVEDLETDTILDRRAHALFGRVMGARSVVLMPLIVGGQRIGFIHAGYAYPQAFSEAERRRLVSLVQQAAIVVLNIRQLRATEARVRREQLIRQITGRIQEAPDVDGVLQTAVREIGRALGTSRNRIQFGPRGHGGPQEPKAADIAGTLHRTAAADAPDAVGATAVQPSSGSNDTMAPTDPSADVDHD